MKKQYRFIYPISLLLGLSLVSGVSASWLAKSDKVLIDQEQIETFLAFQNAKLDQVPASKRSALLENWFVRESLTVEAKKIKLEESDAFQEKMAEYRKDLLAKMALQHLSSQKLPDFTDRAKEIYEAKKTRKYHLPASVKVKQIVLNMDQAALAGSIYQRLESQEIDFDKAIKEYSVEKKSLARSKGVWVSQKKSVSVFFDRAMQLSKEQTFSEPFEDRGKIRILSFVDKQEEKQVSFDEAKEEIIAELQKEYTDTERKIILDKIKKDFAENVTVNPEFLN